MIALVAVTAQGAAFARGLSDPAGQMVICTGTGPVMVYTDEAGNPMSAPHLCPDFALSVLLAVASADAHTLRPARFERVDPHGIVLPAARLHGAAPQARGPPVLV